QYGTAEAAVDGKSFVVPLRFAVLERIGICVIVGGYKLDFGEIYTTKLNCDWAVEIDPPPFSSDHVVGMDRGQRRRARLIAVIRFESAEGDGTDLAATWYDDSYRPDDGVPPN